MTNFEETIKKLVELARSDDLVNSGQVDRVVDAYLRDFAGNRVLERDRIANAFEQAFGRRFQQADDIYRWVKRL